jgi:tetratricopeptide (TPR) repeat protein
MLIVDREIALSPQDMDIRAWRARVLMWSGRLEDAEHEYREILAVSPKDPDNWMGLANVYTREARPEQAEQALATAVTLDPKRVDLHTARGRALRAAHNLDEAKLEFRKALDLDPKSEDARADLFSLQGEPKHEVIFGSNTDLFSFADANHDEGLSLTSQWTSRWRTTAGASFYRSGGTDAEKISARVTGKTPRWGALTIGGAMGHDNGVIPKAESFFDYDRGWKIGGNALLRGLEIDYGQHWYWYSTARILTFNQMTIFYLPHAWTWSLGLTGARSDFSGTGTEWRPSGVTRIGFPITGNDKGRLEGNLLFAVGTEDFAEVNQIGHFSSQTYGGGLRLQVTQRQYVKGVTTYQKRTQDRSETSFGFIYGVRF